MELDAVIRLSALVLVLSGVVAGLVAERMLRVLSRPTPMSYRGADLPPEFEEGLIPPPL